MFVKSLHRFGRRKFLVGSFKTLALALAAGYVAFPQSIEASRALLDENNRPDAGDIFRILKILRRSGFEFSEVFIERRIRRVIDVLDNEVQSDAATVSEGTALRIRTGTEQFEVSVDGFLKTEIKDAARALAGKHRREKTGKRPERLADTPTQRTGIFPLRTRLDTVTDNARMELIHRAYNAANASTNLKKSIRIVYTEQLRHIVVANTLGHFRSDAQPEFELDIQVRSHAGKRPGTGRRRIATRNQRAIFRDPTIEDFAREAVESSVHHSIAGVFPDTRLPVILAAGSGAKLFQSIVAPAVSGLNTDRFYFSSALDHKIASAVLTLVDNGTIQNAVGSVGVDDEGTYSRRTSIIEQGVLKDFLLDRATAEQLNRTPSGNFRRAGYGAHPVISTTNLRILPGQDDPVEILRDTPRGIYCKVLSDGDLDPRTGIFRIPVQEAFEIKNGMIRSGLRDGYITGDISDVLRGVDRVANNLLTEPGRSSADQRISTTFGGPAIRIQGLKVSPTPR